jgi:outer membrane protein, multidrug efflux system
MKPLRQPPLIEQSIVTLVTTVSMMLFSGCASLPPAPDLQVALPEQWQNATPAPAMAMPPAAGDGREWWHSFQDPALDRLVEAALTSNLTIAAAREHLRSAQILVPVADAVFRPNLFASTGSESTPDARNSYFQANLGALWELPVLKRGENARRGMASRAVAEAADLGATRVKVASDVTRGYFEVLAAARSITLLRGFEKVTQNRLTQLHTRARIGLETHGEDQSIESEMLSIQSRIAELELAQCKVLQQIAAVLGQTAADSSWVPARDTFPTLALRVESTPADLLRERPDVRRAQAEVMQAAAELGISRADLYPHVSLGGALTAAVPLGGARGSGTNSVFSAGPIIQVPLFDWGARRAAADARAAELSAAVFAYRQTVFDAAADVEVALATVQHATKLIDLQQRAVLVGDEIARRSGVSRRAGLKEDAGPTSAERSALEARLRLTAAEYAGAVAIVDLHQALGGASLTPDS